MRDELDDFEEGSGLPAFVSDPIGVLRRRWKLMLAVFTLGLVATVVLVYTRWEPLYQASATVQITSKSIREDYVPTVTQVDPFEQVNAIVGDVTSRARLADLIERHDLYPEIRTQRTLAVASAIMLSNIEITPQMGVDAIQRRNQSARLFSVEFTYDDPITAAVVTNELAHLFTDISIGRSSEQTRVTKEFLERELEKVESELQTLNRRIAEFRTLYRGELPEDLETNLRTLERLEMQNQSTAEQISDAENRIIVLSTDDSDGASPEVRLRNLQALLAQQTSLYTEDHPNVMGLRRQIDALQDQIRSGTAIDSGGGEAENARLIEATRREIARLRALQAETEADITAFDQKVANTPSRQEELAGLSGHQEVLNAKYTEFLRKVQDAEMSEDVQIAQLAQRFSVLEEASPPEAPIHSGRKLLMLGIIGTLLGTVGIGFLLELIDPVVINTKQFGSLVQAEVLGSVPHVR